MKTLYFDESGNTGKDLLNKDQRYFVLASVDFDESTSKEMLMDAFGSVNNEIHFKSKKNNDTGKQQILSFLSKNIETIREHSRITVVDKEFSVPCNLLIYCLEPLLYEEGIDYLDGGRNIAEANIFYHFLKEKCGVILVRTLYRNFINYFEKRDDKSKEKLLSTLELIRGKYDDYFGEYFLDNLICSIRDHDGFLSEGISLDPAYYSLSGLIHEWLKSTGEQVKIVHDDSSALKNIVPLLYPFFKDNPDEKEVMIGYGDHKTPFPLNENGPIDFVTSDSSYSIQVCDLLASVSAYCHNNSDKKDDVFCKDLIKYAKDFPYIDCIIPSKDIRPIKDRIKREGDLNPIDYMAAYMYNKEKSNS